MEKNEATDEECLQMTTYSVNSVMVPGGLVPMLLVFGAVPRPARTAPATGQLPIGRSATAKSGGRRKEGRRAITSKASTHVRSTSSV